MTDNTDIKKKMLEALEFNLGIVSHSCRTVNISRQTHYQWLKTDASYKEEVDCITESAIDYVESKLYERIKANDTASIIFYLKTRAKSRGYQERTELVMPEARKFEIEVLGPADESTN
jgi:predicted RNA-binding Zn ribbon-like protein